MSKFKVGDIVIGVKGLLLHKEYNEITLTLKMKSVLETPHKIDFIGTYYGRFEYYTFEGRDGVFSETMLRLATIKWKRRLQNYTVSTKDVKK